MIMDSFEVYRYYLALRLHFTTDKYDVIKQQGRVRASKQAFYRREDLHAIRKVAETYSDKEVVNFLVSNFIAGDRWGGVFDVQSKENYKDWQRRIESLSYIFEQEVGKINTFCMKHSIPFEHCFHPVDNQHPYIIKLYLQKTVSIETMVILNKLNNFVEDLDLCLSEDLVWPDISRIIKKYTPFLTIKKEKYDGILRRTIGSD